MLPSFDSSKSKGKRGRQNLMWVIPWIIALLALSFSTFLFFNCHKDSPPPPPSSAAPPSPPAAPQTPNGIKQELQEKQIQDLHRKVKGLQMTIELLTDAMGALNTSNHLHPSVSYDRHGGGGGGGGHSWPVREPPAPEHAHEEGRREREGGGSEHSHNNNNNNNGHEPSRQTKKKIAANKRSMMRDLKSSCIVRVDGRGPKVEGIDSLFKSLPEVDIPAHDISSIDARTYEECLSYCLCREDLLTILDERIHGDMDSKHRDIDTQNSLKGEVEEWEVCLGVTYLRAQWECWLKTSNDETLAKKTRGDKKINGISVKAPQLQTAILIVPSG